MDPRRIFTHIFTVEVTIAIVVFILVGTAILAALLLSRRRRRTGRGPTRQEEHTKVELTYAAAVALVAAFVVGLSFHATAQESRTSPAAAKVQVTGFQWCWRFAYPASSRTVTGTCVHGDIPTMVVPVGQSITLSITSSDVIHSWWVPALRYKLDAFPNHTNTITIKVDKAGRWIGRCAEFCGHLHTFMDFYLKAVPAQQYRQWLAGSSV